MIFRQLFDATSSTYSYLLAAHAGGEALLIDPVLDNVARYERLVNELGLKLVVAMDTHTHADHITGLGKLRELTDCRTIMGERTGADCVSYRAKEGEMIKVDGLALRVLCVEKVTIKFDNKTSVVKPMLASSTWRLSTRPLAWTVAA